MKMTRDRPDDVQTTKTFDEAVSLTGYGKFNLYVLLATGGCLMCVIIETMCAMFLTPAAQCDLRLSLEDKGVLYSISFLGVVTGSHLWGYLADTRGRKLVTLISLISSSLVSFIGSMVSLPWLFIALRFFNGFLIGGSSAIIYAYAGEFHDNKIRPKIISWVATFIALGNIYLPGLAWLILPHQWAYDIPFLTILYKPWRLLMIIYSLPSLLFAILIYFLPESPKYLLSQGKHEEALLVLKKMYSVNTGKCGDNFPVTAIFWDEVSKVHHDKNEGLLKSMWNQTIPLFRKEYLLKTLMVSFLQFVIFFSASAVVMWYPQVLNSMTEYEQAVPSNEVTMCKSILYHKNDVVSKVSVKNSSVVKSLVSESCTDTVNEEVFIVSLIIGACYAVCYLLIGAFINIIGPRRLLVGLIAITTISGIGAQILSGYNYIQITLGLFLMVATGVGVVNAVVVDLYPTQIRGMALAVSLMFGRFGAVTGSNTAGYILHNICDSLFYILAASHALVIITILLLPSEKK